MTMTQRIDALLSAAVQAGDVPGVAAMVTDRSGCRYEGAFGVRVLGQPAPMTTDTVGWIASMTKAITAAGAMQLVEQGRLDLDAPAARVVPEIATIGVLTGFDVDGRAQTRPAQRPITLRHLLTHTAGFGYDTWNPEVGRYQRAQGLPLMQTGRTAALHTPLLFDPGERWNYSIGIDWAGRMIEAASGLRLGEYLTRHLFDPLGMDSTRFRISPAMRERLAKVHQRDEEGRLTPLMDMEVTQQPEFEGGGGGLYSSVADYLKFVRMILDDGLGNGNRVLQPATVAQMAGNRMGELRVNPMRSSMPARSLDAEFFPGVPKGWGLSFQINLTAAPTGRPAGGLMWAGLTNCYQWIDRDSGLGGVYLTQVLPFADRRSLPLYYAFETAVYDAVRQGG